MQFNSLIFLVISICLASQIPTGSEANPSNSAGGSNSSASANAAAAAKSSSGSSESQSSSNASAKASAKSSSSSGSQSGAIAAANASAGSSSGAAANSRISKNTSTGSINNGFEVSQVDGPTPTRLGASQTGMFSSITTNPSDVISIEGRALQATIVLQKEISLDEAIDSIKNMRKKK